MAKINQTRERIFDSMLGWFPAGRLVDLGAGHGSYSIRAADAGWDVTAVDARTVRFPEDDRVKWVHQDVRETSLEGYDVIVNLGLFYHLTLDDQLSLLARASGTPMILDTHVSTKDPKGYGLSGLVSEQGYRGRYYSERKQSARASWKNMDSFWPTPASLRRMLDENGFDLYTLTPYYLPTRTFFLCQPRTGERPRHEPRAPRPPSPPGPRERGGPRPTGLRRAVGALRRRARQRFR